MIIFHLIGLIVSLVMNILLLPLTLLLTALEGGQWLIDNYPDDSPRKPPYVP